MDLLELDSLVYRYPGRTELALAGASLRVSAGERMAIIGSNGSGKSTLLLHANGTLRPSGGQVRFAGKPVSYDRRGLLMLRRHVGIVFQNPDEQLFSASVAQDISFGPLNLGLDAKAARRRVEEAAELCGITHLLDRPTHALSGGEKTCVALAGVLAMNPQVIIADEVTSGLDPWMRDQVLAIFDRLARQGKAIVLSTHDLDVAWRWADQVAFMQAGRVLFVTPPKQMFTNPTILALTKLDQIVAR
ncbi:MAG: ABC transporter ATP-binding protein [Anaerolineae bacterium]|nr:ABC transporter ATP-binding protein [Anaerolineae bacterium]